MKTSRKTRLLTQEKQFRPRKGTNKRNEKNLVERSEVTCLLSKKVSTPCFPRFSPSSPQGWSLQTPHAQWRSEEPVTILDPSSENATNLQRKLLFQLVFLNEDENQSVEVKEVEEIDFVELKKRLDEGKSVFITTKENEKIEILNIGEQGADRERRKRGA